jgi:uncharacterized membrane protein
MILSIVVLCAGLIFKFLQPRNIGFYGYRTAASIRNINTWKFANEYAAMWLVRVALGATILSLALSGYFDSYIVTEQIMAPIVVLGLVFVIVKTEQALKKYADRIDSNEL